MKSRVVVVGFLLTLLAACSSVTAGRVDSKEFIPGHYETEQVSEVSVGQVSVPIYGDVWHDDAWRTDLRTAEGDTGSVWVDRETFEQLVIGQYADLGGTS